MNEDIFMPVYQVEFWINGKEKYAMRHLKVSIPTVGDEVRFKNVVYSITNRIWFYDEDVYRVALSIVEVKHE